MIDFEPKTVKKNANRPNRYSCHLQLVQPFYAMSIQSVRWTRSY